MDFRHALAVALLASVAGSAWAAAEIVVEQPTGSDVADGDQRGFGLVPVGATGDLVFTVRNIGDATLNLTGTTIDGSGAGAFAVFAPPGATVAPGASTSLTLRYTPTTGTISSATLHLTSNDADESPFDIGVDGIGGAPDIVVDQAGNIADGGARSFADTDVGQSRSLDFSIRNAGLASLTLTGNPRVALSGANAGDFSVTTQPALTAIPAIGVANASFEAPVVPAGSHQLRPLGAGWRFVGSAGINGSGGPWSVQPPPSGAQSAYLQIRTDSTYAAFTGPIVCPFDAPYGVYFAIVRRGNGYGPVNVDLSLDGVIINGVSVFEQTNDQWQNKALGFDCPAGVHQLTFSSSSGQGSDSASAIDDIKVIPSVFPPPPLSTMFRVAFAPTASGPRTASLSIASDDPDEAPFDIVLSGNGVTYPEIAVDDSDGELADGSERNFGTVAMGGTLDHMFTVRNTGPDVPLSGLVATFEGPDAARFTLLAPPPASIVGGASATFTVRYTAAAAGHASAVLHLANNDRDENPFEIVLHANLAAQIAVERGGNRLASGATIALPPAFQSEGAPADFVVRNAGATPLVLGASSVSVSGPNAGDFSVTVQPAATLVGVGLHELGFEVPALAAGTFQPTPTATGWQFSGNAGIATNGSPWYQSAAPDGVQAAYLQTRSDLTSGAISRGFLCPVAGSYRVRFSLARRGGGYFPPNLAVRVDGVTIDTINASASLPLNNSWASFELGFTCASAGAHTLSFAAIPVDGLDRALALDDVRLYGPGASTSFQVAFSPTALGPRQATVSIASNDADENPFQLVLTGSGIPPEIAVEQPTFSPVADGGSRDFGQVMLGTSAPFAFVIDNVGGFPLNLTGTPRVAISGADASDFSVTLQPETPLLPPIHVDNPNFAAGTNGWQFSGSAVANASPGYDDSYAAALVTGGGASSAIAQTLRFNIAGRYTLRFAAGIDYDVPVRGPVDVKLDGAQVARIESFSENFWDTFTVPLTIATAGLHELRFEATSAGSSATAIDNITVDGAATFVVAFSPTVSGPRSAMLSIASDDADESPYDIALSGTGASLAEMTVEQPLGSDLADGGSRGFGTVAVGSSASLDFSISNRGSQALLLGGTPRVAVTGADAADFTVTAVPAASIAATGAVAIGNSDFETPVLADFDFQYRPTGAGWDFVHFTGVAANLSPWVFYAPSGRQVAYIQTREDDESALSSISQSLTFGAPGEYLVQFAIVRRPGMPPNTIEVRVDGALIGRVRASAQPDDTFRTYTFSYQCPSAGAHTLSFVGVLVDGDRASAIDAVRVDGPVSRTTFRVAFTPSTAGARSAALRIATNDTDENPFDIVLDGTGAIAPEIALEQPAGSALADGGSRNFGSVAVGANADLVVTVRNTGSADLTGLGITIDGVDAAQFSVTAPPAAPVIAGGSTTFTVRFAPTATGGKHAVLHVASNDADENPYDVALDGTGAAAGPEIALEQPAGTPLADGGARAYGDVAYGAFADRVFTVRNTGSDPLTGLGVAIGGMHASQFSVTTAPTAPVAPGASTTFTVRFAPTSLGTKAATLQLASNDADENPYDVALSGVGVAASADLSITKTNGESSLVPGRDTVYTIEVVNGGPATVSSVHVVDALPSGLNNAQWLCTSTPPGLCPSAGGNGGIDQTTSVPLISGALLHYELAATPSGAGAISNTASVGNLDPNVVDGVAANDTATDSDPIVGDLLFGSGFE